MIKKTLKIIGILIIVFLALVGFFIYSMNSSLEKLSNAELINNKMNDTIPFRYSNSGHILIDVSLDNKRTYPFILDSGASNMIFENFESKKQLVNNGYSLGIGSNGSVFWSTIKKINYLKIGNLKFKNLNFELVDLKYECLDAYGIIGIGIMRKFVWQIDFAKKIIIISDKINNKIENKKILEFDLSENPFGHQLSIPISLSKKNTKIKATIDLGSNSNLSINEKYIIKDSLDLQFNKIYGRGSSGLGDSEDDYFDEKFYLLDTVRFSNSKYEIYNFPVMASPKTLKSNLLGIGFFEKYKTTISWIDKKLILEPYDESSPNFKWKTKGFSTRYDKNKNKVFIKSLIENSPATNSNISIDDEVISINGINPLNEYCQMLLHIRKVDTLDMKIKHQTNIKNIQIIKQPIFK